MGNEEDSRFYLLFISIVFAVFLSVWIIRIGELFPPDAKAIEVWEAFFAAKNIIGAIMFLVLVCLWWWYGIFIGKITPANSFPMFGLDFLTLGSFALAFRLWPQPFAFPVAVFVAALLMLVRFWILDQYVKRTWESCPARKATKAALIIIGIFLFASVAAFGGMLVLVILVPGDTTNFVAIAWQMIEWIVMGLLLIGIGVTVYAAKVTQGFEWGSPRPVEEWLGIEESDQTSGSSDQPQP